MRQMHEQQMLQMKAMLDQIVANLPSGMGTQMHIKELDERNFRELGKFEGQDDHWKEWSLKFRAKIKELNMTLFNDLTWAEALEDEITIADVEQKLGADGVRRAAVIYNRLIHQLGSAALTIHQSVPEENGFEVWRILERRFNPLTPMRGLQLMLRVMVPGKIKKGQDFQTHVSKWEGWVNKLERDYKEKTSDMAKIGILISMAPDDLQDTILQHADRLKVYKLVKEKMVGLLDARARLKDPNAVDIGFAGEDDWRWDDAESSDVDVAAIGKGDHCYRCGGVGHIANECPTPKGKGKGKEDKGFNSKGSKGKGKSSSGKGFEKGKGKGMTLCGHCGKRGHDTSRCWTLHPDQLPWKSANYHGDRSDSNGMSVCSLERDTGRWQAVVRKRCEATANRMCFPPGLKINNRFDELSEMVDIGGLEVLMPEKVIGRVGTTERLRSAGKGEVTIDSGAAESVMPNRMPDREPFGRRRGQENGSKVRRGEWSQNGELR